jgi:hypothetical protein
MFECVKAEMPILVVSLNPQQNHGCGKMLLSDSKLHFPP